MFQKLASSAFVFGSLVAALTPAAGLAQGHRGNDGGQRDSSRIGGLSQRGGDNYNRGQSYSGANRNDASRSGGQNYSRQRGGEERHENNRDYRRYEGSRSYRRPAYRGYSGTSFYLGFGQGYGSGYAYNPGYSYGSGYSYAPDYYYQQTPRQSCSSGAYDRYGRWIPYPDCYEDQQYQDYDQYQQYYDPRRR